jgi:hypothetical protein
MQSAANNSHQEEIETWDELQKAGIPVDYDRFAARWDSDPKLKQLVTRFDGRGIVLKTKAKEMPVGAKAHKDLVGQMAKKATSKMFK